MDVPPISIRSWAALVAGALWAAAEGCSPTPTPTPPPAPPTSQPETHQEDSEPAPSTATPASSGIDPYFGAGGTPPAIVFVTGEMHGHLEPCGCTQGQSGGLGRRLDLLNRLRDRGTSVVPVDLGALIDDIKPDLSRGGPEQVKIKLRTALKALKEMGYAGLALSATDLQIGYGDFFAEVINLKGEPPLLAANIQPAAGMEDHLRPSVRVEAGPVTLGITAVIDPASLDTIKADERAIFFADVNDPAEALAALLPELEADTTAQVLLVQGPPEMARDLAERFTNIEIVVARSEYPDPPTEPITPTPGHPLLVQVGHKGQHVGLVGLDPSPGAPLRYRDVRLDTKYENVEPIRTLVEVEYLEDLKRANVTTNYPRKPTPNGARFMGAESCKDCHPKTYDRWSQTKHALMAYKALTDGPRGDRTADAECVSCHTTGFAYESGFVSAETTPWLQNQQCENCHGPASKHVADPTNLDYRREIEMTIERADQGKFCVRCHDGDNDPHYDFKVRWPQVAHTGLDTYDDPDVHRGRDVEALLRAAAAAE